jgi:hypothetical protein
MEGKLYNLKIRFRVQDWLESSEMIKIPIFSISHSFGKTLKNENITFIINIQIDSITTIEYTYNLIGELFNVNKENKEIVKNK